MRDVIRESITEMESANARILQEVACAEDWRAVYDILHRNRQFYFARARASQRSDQGPDAGTNRIAGIPRAPAR
jgi:hypothetical protein